jgi:EAL domain-containing protein (putative c-di-GMP-specific phosphodiesterase class I)/GGDEF domain-containing protein
VASLSPAYVLDLYQSKKSGIACKCGRTACVEIRVYQDPVQKRFMATLTVREIRDQIARACPKPPDRRLDAPPNHPIRMGGTFAARLRDDLPLTSASEGFTDLTGCREGEGWIHPEDAAALLKRMKGENPDAFPFFARLLTASGKLIFARLECRVSPDGDELYGAAFNISDKLAAERTALRLRTANTIVERLATAELDCMSLIDTRTGMLTILSRANQSVCAFQSERFDDLAAYLRERVAAPEVEDCARRMSLDAVKSALAKSDRYELSYSIHEGNEIRRKRWLFSYLDESRDAILLMRSDITDSYMMQFDPVSGLYNRHQFQKEARKLLDAHPDRHFLFVRFDIENFRVFSDLYGASAGNRLIASVKDLINAYHAPLEVCGHIEADHFACVMPEDESSLLPDMGRIREWFKSHSSNFDFSPKIGIYMIDDPALDIATMGDRALLALNSIKGKYGTHIAYYTDSMRERMLREQSVVNDMIQALENGEFEPYIQPQYDHKTGAMIGAELLLRWNHPMKGLLVPKDFVPIFERNGFITQIDKHVWEVACHTQRRWLDMGLPVVPLSVNVSRADINDPELCRTLSGIVNRYGLDPKLLRLEITETVYMKNPEQLIEAVKKLRAAGFVVEMDDFGSGYSSLNMLRDVEVDVLKLDMSFLQDSGTDTRGDRILHSVVRMARLLEIPVIAEGVETAEQADYLARVGCRFMQGYFFARPMPAPKFEALLANVNSADRS